MTAARSAQECRRVTGLAALAKQRLLRLKDVSGGQVMVGLSGGKDSLAVLDLCCRHINRVEAYHMRLVPGLEVFEAPVDAAAKRHGVVVHKIPHFDLSRLVRNSVMRVPTKGSDGIRKIALRDVETALRARTGIEWFATGERAADCFKRRFYTRVNDGISVAPRRAYPIWDWLDRDVYGYLQARKIQPPDSSGYRRHGANGSGFLLHGQCLSWLKREHPPDWARVLKVFPYAEAEISRWEAQREERERTGREPGDALPSVQGSPHPSLTDSKCDVQSAED